MTKTTDFIRATMLAHEEAQRQTGRTTKIALGAIQSNAVMVCHNHAFAHSIAKEYERFGLKTIGLDLYLQEDYHRNRSHKQRYVFDHFAEYALIMKKLDEVEKTLNV